MLRTPVVAICFVAFCVAASCASPSAPAKAGSDYPAPPGHAAWLAARPQLAFPGWHYWRTDLDLLRRTNREVNAALIYRTEEGDAWGVGADCEDFALRKLETLLAAGVPRGALRLGIVRVAGEGHAVLVVGDLWVLDNRRDEPFRRDRSALRIEAWETTGGRWTPAGGFATLAEHLQWSQSRSSAVGQ